MKSKQLAGYLFSALMLTCFQQGTAQTTYNGSVGKAQNQQPQPIRMGMAPKCDNQGRVDMWAEFLYWSTNFSSVTPGMSIELDQIIANINQAPDNTRLKTKSPSRGWDPGVRLGIGCNTRYDNWDVQGYWTYFYNSSSRNDKPLELDFGNTDIFNDGNVKVRLRYNAADVELGKSYYVSSHFFVRPLVGAHTVWLSQHHDENFVALNSFEEVITAGFESVQSFWGLGPRIGINTNWGCFKGFSLMGNISTSVLYADTLIKSEMDINDVVPPIGPQIDISIRQKQYWQIVPTLQLLLGISYGCCFNDERNQLRLSAGWETNFLWQASNFLAYERPVSMQGLTAQVRFDF